MVTLDAPPSERAALKARAVAEIPDLDGHTFTKGQLSVTIASPRAVGTDVVLDLVVRRGARDVTPADLNPVTIRNPPVLVPDPAGAVVRAVTVTKPDGSKVDVTTRWTLDPRAALLVALRDVLP